MIKNFSSKDTVGAILLAVVSIAILIACVKLIGMVLFKDDDNQKIDSTTPTIITTDETKTIETSPTTKNRKDIDKQIAAAIAQAEKLATVGDYDEAISMLQTWLKTYSDSEKLQKKLAEYTAARNTQIKVDAIAAADKLKNQGNYLDALLTIRQAIAEIGEDDDLATQAATCESAYVTMISQQVDEFQQKMSISEAKELLREALEHVPENEMLLLRKTQIDEYRTVHLAELDQKNSINGGLIWNKETIAEPNDYENIENWCILHAGNGLLGTHGTEARTYSCEYWIDRQYNQVSFDLIPYSDMEDSGWSYVQIYVDDVLRFTSDKITQKSERNHITVDISNAEYIRFEIYVKAHGCIMLTDAVLTNNPALESNCIDGYTSLSSLDTFSDSKITWNSVYPADKFGNNYCDVINYTFLHAQNSIGGAHATVSREYSVEYHVDWQYSSISFDIAPADCIGDSGSVCVEIRAGVGENLEVKETFQIDKKTNKFNTGDIDISDAEYLKIYFDIGSNGCVILSDALLKNAE